MNITAQGKSFARRGRLCVVGVLLALTFGCHQASKTSTVGAADPANWPTHNGGDDESSFSRLAEINKDTVGRLGLVWSLDLDGEQVLEATPLAVGGVLYFTGSMSAVYAVDALTGKLLWRHDPEIWKHMPGHMRDNFGVNRGAAYADGRVFAGTVDGRLIALDAKTGTLLWSATTVTEDSHQSISGAPRVFKGKVLIGNSGADVGARGYVTAYDAATGQQVWRFYTVPTDPKAEPRDAAMEMAAKTWSGEWWKVSGGGGTVWDAMTYDPEFNRVYIGVGNSGPYNPELRSPGGGDNLFLTSIVALNADTGKYVWHYQMNPREAWDYKATNTMIATTLTIDGQPRKVLMQSPTNGFFYVLDRTNGKLISAEKTGKVTWAERIDVETGRPVEAPNIRYETGESVMWPGPGGSHNWQSMAYNPQTGLVYIPYIHLGARFTLVKGVGSDMQLGGVSIRPVKDETHDNLGALIAWDPVAQKPRWKVWYPTLWNGGVMTTAGGLVFQGNADGELAAFDGESGAKLWRFDAKLGIVAAPITYQVQGKQYVSILVGYGSAAQLSDFFNRGWKFGAQPRRLLTFVLDGKATLPPTAPRDFVIHALDDPALTIDPAQAAAGATIYGQQCALCHGAGLLSMGAPAPDLRESATALDPAAVRTVLHDGALMPRGMPRFEMLSDADVNALYMYIRAGAREALNKDAPTPVVPDAAHN